MRLLFWRRKREEDLDAEIQSHLRMAAHDRVERGEEAREAERSAKREIGNVALVMETTREIWGWRWLADFVQDTRYGLRMLRKNPAFLAAAVISLALGVGANATVFSFINALLFRSPAVKAQGELLELSQTDRRSSGIESFSPMSYPSYEFYRDSNQVFSGLAGFDGEMRPTSWSNAGSGELIQGQLVSSNFFSILGVEPELGRGFIPEEGRLPAGDLAVMLSYGFWQRAMGGDRGAIGRSMTLNGKPFTIVGIVPEKFCGIIIGTEPDYWTTFAAARTLTNDRSYLENWDTLWLLAVGRLKPGITPAAARASLVVLAKHLQEMRPASNKDIEAVVYPLQLVPAPVRGYVDAFGGLLMAVVGMVLLIACANTANLVMANVASRRRETAVRSALGASRTRLIRQAVTESLLLAALGGAFGLLLTLAAVPEVMRLKPSDLPVRIGVTIDWHVIAFGGFVSFLMGLCFGLLQVFRRAGLGMARALGDGRGNAGPRHSLLRSWLVVAQLSICLLLLIGAGLCLRSLLNAQSIDPGFDTRHTALVTINPGSLGYSEKDRAIFYKQLIAHMQSLAGVSRASLTAYLPLATASDTNQYEIEGRQLPPGMTGFSIYTMYVGPEFFQTMGISLLQGRGFTESDAGAVPAPVVVNEALARRNWPGQNPIGKYVTEPGAKGGVKMIVAGVASTGKYRTLSERPMSVVYRLIGATPQATLLVRTEGDPRFLLDAMRREIRQLDPNVVPLELETMRQYMNLPLFPARTAGVLLTTFGILGLVLAVTGIYGVTSYTVGQRTHEIGVRMALGATRSDVLRLVLRQGLRLTSIGLVIGLGAALGLTRVLSNLLYGISSTDPVTFLAVPALMASVTLLACYLPARRATQVDPIVALRYE